MDQAYSISHPSSSESVVSGTLRLSSPNEYESVFQSIKDDLDACKDEYVIDISQLIYLNSSGLTSLARLFIQARNQEIKLIIKASKDIPWQDKTIPSLQKLYSKISVQYS